MTSYCLLCGTSQEPRSVRKFKGLPLARYRCPQCKCRWLVCWDAASLAGAAA